MNYEINGEKKDVYIDNTGSIFVGEGGRRVFVGKKNGRSEKKALEEIFSDEFGPASVKKIKRMGGG